MEKVENASNQYFLLFPQCILPYQRQKFSLKLALDLSSADTLNLVLSKKLSFGKKLTLTHQVNKIDVFSTEKSAISSGCFAPGMSQQNSVD